MRLFHRTASEAASAIVEGGFRDGTGSYGTSRQHEGVWVSDIPLDINAGAEGPVLLAIDGLEETEILAFEWVEDFSKGYREFLVPAALLNARGKIFVAEDDSEIERELERQFGSRVAR